MTDEQLSEIARGAIERNLGDVVDDSPDSVYDNAFVLAHDALMDRGIDPRTCSRIAQAEAQKIAQP